MDYIVFGWFLQPKCNRSKLLQRFHRITGKEIMNLAEDNDGNSDYDSMGRLLGMCNFLGIELDSSCAKVYLLLEIRREKILEKAEELYDKDDALSAEVLEQNIEQLIEWIDSTDSEKCRKLFHSNDHLYDFIKKCLNEYGFPTDYLEYDMTQYNRTEQLLTILNILKQIDPDKEITFDELFGYLPVINLVKTITSDCEYFQNEFCVLLGEKTKAEFDDLLLFDSSKIQVQPKKQATNTKMKLISNVAPIKTDEVNTTDYLEEISSLRTKLHEKENEIMRLKELYRSSKFARNEYANLQKKYEDQREELIALREFAYRSAKGFEELPQTTIDEMKSAVEKKEIIIVGGHTNWINKVQKFFPNWSIIPANASRTVDTNIFSGKEHVYFFTDYLDHNTYGKYITTCREKRIPFGYLHGVNIETMIQQIYKDICE